MKYFLYILTCSSYITFSQNNVTIIKDARIDDLVKKQSEIVPPATEVQVSGFRLQLFFDSDRGKIDEVRAEFGKNFPEVATFVTFNAPNYFLRVGNFRSSLEAEKLKAEVKEDYPMAFVVKEKINLPRLD